MNVWIFVQTLILEHPNTFFSSLFSLLQIFKLSRMTIMRHSNYMRLSVVVIFSYRLVVKTAAWVMRTLSRHLSPSVSTALSAVTTNAPTIIRKTKNILHKALNRVLAALVRAHIKKNRTWADDKSNHTGYCFFNV